MTRPNPVTLAIRRGGVIFLDFFVANPSTLRHHPVMPKTQMLQEPPSSASMREAMKCKSRGPEITSPLRNLLASKFPHRVVRTRRAV
jgi:hypothetical protein